jgi:hypothetical protein
MPITSTSSGCRWTLLEKHPMRDTTQPIGLTIPSAASMTGLGRTRIYELIGAGVLDARKAGRRTIIMGDSLRAYLSTLPPASVRAPRQKAAA